MSSHLIDFVPHNRPSLIGSCVLMSGLAASIAVAIHGWATYEAHLARAQHVAAMAAMQQASQAKSARAATPHINLFTDPRWQAAAVDLRWPWQAMLQNIESATRPPVLLLAVRPNSSNDSLTLDAESPTIDSALEYLGRLRGSPLLENAQLLSHDEFTDTATGLKQVKFTISGQWRGQP